MSNRPTSLAGTHRIVVRHVFSAPCEAIFALWTDAKRMPEWILDGGSATLDVRVGGRYHMEMGYEGKIYPHDGEYLEIVPPERLVFTWISEATNWQPSIVTIELVARGDQTEMILTHEGLPETRVKDHEEGWTEIGGWLEKLLQRDARPAGQPQPTAN